MKTMKLSDIKITEAFESTHPSPDKIRKKKEQWLKTGRQRKYIVVNKDGYLVDGYITYLIMKELGVEEAKIIKKKSWMNPIENLEIKEPAYRTENTTYVWGVHPNSPDNKLYVWRVPNGGNWNEFKKNITVGDMVFCYAKGKVSPVIIKAIQTTDFCPTPLDVKKVCSKNIVKGSENNA